MLPVLLNGRYRVPSRLRVVCAVVGLLALCDEFASAGPRTWGTNGTVLALAASGNTVYLGGTFSIVGPATGSGTVVSPVTAEPLGTSPEIAGTVNAVVSDGAGGWFVAGSIVGIGDGQCSNLAHVDQDGGVSPWHPAIDGPIYALARSGWVLYVGGAFQHADGEPRSNAAAFDARSGQLTGWNPSVDNLVRVMAAHRGCVFIGGRFTRVGGQLRNHLAKVTGDTGVTLPWVVDANSDVASFALAGDTLYIGGYFGVIAGEQRSLLAAVDAETGALTSFDPHGVAEPLSDYDALPSAVKALAISGGSLFVGGHFVGMGGQDRVGLAEVDRVSGAATGWAPSLGPVYSGWPTPSVHTLTLCDGKIYLGGDFSTVDGLPRGRAAQFVVDGGVLTPWDPRANDVVYAMAPGARVFIGGGFTTQWSWEARRGLAAIDATTGELLPWNPASDVVTITSLAAGGGKVYVSGLFSTLGGQPRSNIAAVDSISGLATPWNPQANNAALSMVLSGTSLYAGGMFTSIGGASRPFAAKLDTASGVASAWNPACDDWVTSLAVGSDQVFLGGWFRQAGGQARSRLAAVDTSGGAPTPWAPAADGPVSALALSDSIVMVGGWFATIGGAAHAGLAALDRESGTTRSWNLDVGAGVTSIVASGGVIYVSGDFSAVGGQDRLRAAAIDGRSGTIEDWHLDPDGVVWASAPRDNGVWLGGAFTVVGGKPAPGIAGVDGPALGRSAPGASLFLAQSAPNPARDRADIAFELRADAIVSLDVFDLTGRRVSNLVPAVLFAAGPHRVSVRTAGWKPGCYFYRLKSSGASATRKMIVVK